MYLKNRQEMEALTSEIGEIHVKAEAFIDINISYSVLTFLFSHKNIFISVFGWFEAKRRTPGDCA